MNLLLSLGGGGPESGGPPFEDATPAVVDSKDAAAADVASPEDLLQEAMALERANANLAAGLDELAAWRDGVEEKVDALGKVPGRYLVSSGRSSDGSTIGREDSFRRAVYDYYLGLGYAERRFWLEYASETEGGDVTISSGRGGSVRRV